MCLGLPCLLPSSDAQEMSTSHATDEDTDTLGAYHTGNNGASRKLSAGLCDLQPARSSLKPTLEDWEERVC